MSYKTILLHLNDEHKVARLVNAALQIAEKFEAHVTALYVLPPVPTYGSMVMGSTIINSSMQGFRKEAERVKAAFDLACKGRTVVPEWRLEEARQRGVAETVMEHARTADLVIAGQRDPDYDFSIVLDVPERLAVETGRPVLVIPRVGDFPTIGSRVTVAWNGGREAARATFDALPLLQLAQSVRVVSVSQHDDGTVGRSLPTTEIATTLARHGIRVEAAMTTAENIKVGDALLSGLCDEQTDLLVMGAYGHSRFREMVFGGATQHILAHMTAPVLLSH